MPKSPWTKSGSAASVAASLSAVGSGSSGGGGGLLQSKYSETSSPITTTNGGTGTPTLSNTTLLTSITITPHAIGNALRIRCATRNTKSYTGDAELHIFDSSGNFIKRSEASLQGGFTGPLYVIAQIIVSLVSPVTIQARARGNNEASVVNGCSLEVEEISAAVL
jgi:hypothetical protein